MPVLVVGEYPPEITEFLARRRALGQDLHDEVWEGVYHVAPHAGTEHGQVAAQILLALERQGRPSRQLFVTTEFNLGAGPDDFRVPDGGWFAEAARGAYSATAVAVLEVLSPGDETYKKFDFYLSRGVQEILVAHPDEHWVTCYVAAPQGFVEWERSLVFGVVMTELASVIRWP